MKSRWNVKGETASSIILWLSSLTAALICIAWLAKSMNPDHITLQEVDNELTNIQNKLNKACNMDFYWDNYNPTLSEGTLIIKNLQVCIDSGPCNVIFYNNEPIIDVGKVILNVSNCDKIENCAKYYYRGNETIEIINDTVTLHDSTDCEVKHPSITRCRLLTCKLNTTQYINFEDIYYINITKNVTFTFQAK